jgi:hypothetical protein
MGWSEAVVAARRLSDALAAEAERARAERRPIRELDADGIHARAAERAAFQDEARGLERALAAALADLERQHAPAQVAARSSGAGVVERLRRADPVAAAPLVAAVAAVRRNAAALRELDRTNHELAGSALAWVRGYLAAVRPAPTGYDRRGLAPGAAVHAATVSRRA